MNRAKGLRIETRDKERHDFKNCEFEVTDRFLVVFLGNDVAGDPVRATFPLAAIIRWTSHAEVAA